MITELLQRQHTGELTRFYDFDLASISVGVETEETSGTDKSGYFVGLTFPEVGPGSVSLGLGTQANYTDAEDRIAYL